MKQTQNAIIHNPLDYTTLLQFKSKNGFTFGTLDNTYITFKNDSFNIDNILFSNDNTILTATKTINNNTYTINFKKDTEDGIGVYANTSDDTFIKLKGFDVYDKDGNRIVMSTITGNYIPNAGNIEDTTDFMLSRKSMLFRGGAFAFGLPNEDPYITINPGSFNLSSQGEVNISSAGQTTINGGISVNLVGSSNIQMGNTLNSPTQYIKLSGGKFEVKTSSGSLYLNDHFTYEGDFGSTRKLKLNITDTFAYSDITNNTTNYSFYIQNEGLQFKSDKYKLQLTPVSFVVETSGTNKASINIGTSVFTVQSHNSATNYGTLSFNNHTFWAYYKEKVNNEEVIDYELQATSGALTYTQNDTKLLNINSGGFTIGNSRITDNLGDITLNAAENKKAYYVKNNAEPTANDEIATVGTVSGYIPNAGNDIGDDFSLSRYSIALSGGGGISLWGCNSNISIDDFEDSNATVYINGLGRTIIFGNDGKIDLQGSVEITSGTTYNETINDYTPRDITLNSAKDIILNAAENQKVYYVKNDATPTADDEIATVGTVSGGYIPNAGNNDNTLDFTLTRKDLNLKAKTNITFGADTGNPYLSANPGNFNVSTSAITMSSGGPFTIYNGNEFKVYNASTSASSSAYFGLYTGALQYQTNGASLYVGSNRIQFGTNHHLWAFWGNKNEITGDVINYCQSDTTFSASSTNVYDITLNNNAATISYGAAINGKKHSFGISGGMFQVYSSISNNGYGNITFGSPYFNVIYNENNAEKWFFKLNDSAFTINDKIKYGNGNITLNADENKKAYYVKNNVTPTANDEIATKGDISSVSGGIPNTGNTDDTINFTLVRQDFDIHNSYAAGILSKESDIKVFANQGDVHITTDLTNYKAYYYDYIEDTPTADREIAVKGDLDNYVLKSDFDQLLNAYNDLCDRLNQFLEETGNVEPEVNDYIVTKSLNSISFSIVSQHANDDYTIDWGDGTTDLSGDGTLSHNYSETDNYTIKIIPNNDDADGRLSGLKNLITEINISNIDCANIAEDDTIEKITVNNMIIQSGSWYSALASELGVLEELYIKDNCRLSYENPVAEYCPNLTKITIDSEITNLGQDLVMNCPNVEELHLTSTTMPTFIDPNYSLFDNIPQNLTIYVPNDLLNDYKTALPDYATYIIGE